ncbi:mandelate racemase/muconate lactonizing enzyme family protein [Pseudovibrio brasiliensis]|uniref:Mandelate racemase/muconate lactonizing enzyme family protein n=1 Tax=Pseudovibrio brasiliensis TaxID=1898042 RepID=A0ABX8AZH9_9HYPH|nr:mandelate racemase/muconate lactonizing enzyme family protein [Pseudovibrio brasiliensis]QUS58691.1 mandelate racemase/muconate lactonizing enzyme family protein [Pseudovibrio brasiliensis]
MKIIGIETINLKEFRNVTWVRVHTDAGSFGLGETFYGSDAVCGFIHETLADELIGRDPTQIDAISRLLLNPICGFNSTGAEMRAASAIDIALWDLAGKTLGVPVHQLLGGKSRDKIRAYNTCAGYEYVKDKQVNTTEDWSTESVAEGPYEDLEAFLSDAGTLAKSLLDMGFRGMKIWPFDQFAVKTNGTYISPEDLEAGLRPFKQIREAVGDAMDIHVELHSVWNLPMAEKIARALKPYNVFWLEDPIKMTNVDALAEYARRADTWVTASENLATRWSFRELFEKRATDVCMLDIGWCGGLTEAKKIATMAETYELPVAPHDCTGPGLLTAAVHLSINLPNALVQEMVRAFYFGWYSELMEGLPVFENGYLLAPTAPGLGISLSPKVFERSDATIRITGTKSG